MTRASTPRYGVPALAGVVAGLATVGGTDERDSDSTREARGHARRLSPSTPECALTSLERRQPLPTLLTLLWGSKSADPTAALRP